MIDVIERIQKRYPSCSELLDLFDNIYQEVSTLPIQEFFEPVSVIDASKKKHELIAISPEHLNAWTQHIAYSTRARMRQLERAMLAEAAQDRMLSAMVLIRSHMEAAGLAALCINTFTEFVKSEDIHALRELMLKTMFGTSLKRAAKKDETLDEILRMSEQETITISRAIDAMDEFGQSGRRCKRMYALLCECAHPNPRSAKGFMEAIMRRDEAGWTIKYHEREDFGDKYVNMAFHCLCHSMRVGYAASELLRLSRSVSTDEGASFSGASDEDFKRIWTKIMQMPIDEQEIPSDEENGASRSTPPCR